MAKVCKTIMSKSSEHTEETTLSSSKEEVELFRNITKEIYREFDIYSLPMLLDLMSKKSLIRESTINPSDEKNKTLNCNACLTCHKRII